MYCADGINDQINMCEFLVPDEERFVLIRQSSFPRHIFRMVSCSHGLVPPMLQSRINTNEFLILKKCEESWKAKRSEAFDYTSNPHKLNDANLKMWT